MSNLNFALVRGTCWFAILVWVLQLAPLALGQERQRVTIVQGAQGWTVRADDGELLRGVAIATYEYQRLAGKSGHLTDPAFWQQMRSYGLNAVRLVAFDPWQRSHGEPNSTTPFPYADFSNPADLNATLVAMDGVVAMAATHGMYVMINYHDTGGYRDPDHSKPTDAEGHFPYQGTMINLRKFWRAVSARYANRTHVFFEIVNEPVEWSSFHYTDRDLLNFKSIYDDVRARAPQTHVVLCSFANTYSFGQASMLAVANKIRSQGITFQNESIGFHPYNLNAPRRNNRIELDQLRKRYPVLNTEQNYPLNLVVGSKDPDATGYDGDRFGVQSMERMGISWFHWNSSDPVEFRDNFVKRVIFDAKRRGYYWVPAP